MGLSLILSKAPPPWLPPGRNRVTADAFSEYMNLIIIHNKRDFSAADGCSLLRGALSSDPVAGVVLDGMSRGSSQVDSSISSMGSSSGPAQTPIVCAVPESWGIKPGPAGSMRIVSYAGKVPVGPELLNNARRDSWFVVSNGRFATQINDDLLKNTLIGIEADMVAVNAEPDLLAAREKVRLTVQGKVAGFRRLYDDSAELAPIPAGWPHHLILRGNILERLLDDGELPESFATVLEICRSNGMEFRAIKVAGAALDLETEQGLLDLCRAGVFPSYSDSNTPLFNGVNNGDADHDETAQREPRFIGKVLFGENVHVDPDVIISGPSIIGDGVKIERGAVISSSIIGSEVCVPKGRFVRDCVVMGPQHWAKGRADLGCRTSRQMHSGADECEKPGFPGDVFRIWPMFSYARYFKLIADVVFALIVLVLFAPIMPFVAMAIKLTSPGPVFYKDNRQGRYGKTFSCLKFRTMSTGADMMQEKLRVASQVDGPQFKIDKDPRVTMVGMFLRNTYIDEIPQFLNVLFGQMSVVGPRPSPESENTLCPSWRDARLSVRPGITGLWQINRTRKPEQDFQEWIHYDTKYVGNLSFWTDVRICALTIRKIVDSFINQF